MPDLHRLLRRQLRRHLGSDRVPAELADLVGAVSEFYHQSDADRRMVERSLQISSDELFEANAALERRVQERTRDLLKAKHEAEAANTAKSSFLAHMSHELRTPLNGVFGMTELLLATTLSDSQERFARGAHRSARMLRKVIDQILDFSKLEAGRVELERIEFDLRAVVEDAVHVHAQVAREKGIALTALFDPRMPSSVHGDPHRLRQAITNLVSNAVKFTFEGEVVTRVAPAATRDDPGRFRFEVRDTGIGIREGARRSVFEPFEQEDSSTTRRFGGTGLGLAICRQIVEAMGGELGVDSEVDRGSTFWFTASFDVVVERRAAPPACPEGAVLPRLEGEPHILVVEDSEINREVAVGMLEALGCDVDVAADGIDALDAVRRNRYDAVLMDVQMPRMDGLEATRQIRRWEVEDDKPAGTRAKIIAVTANVTPADRRRCLEAGMNDFLTKPFDQQKLSDLLRSHLGSRESSPS